MRIKIKQLMLCVLKVCEIPLMHYIIANILHILLRAIICKFYTGLHCVVAHTQYIMVLFDVDPRLDAHVWLSETDNKP